jgi:alcohol dehydrogenase class IV
MSPSFRYIAPPHRLHCGEDSLQQLPAELDRAGCRRAVVFCGRTLATHPKGLKLVSSVLGRRFAGAFDGVQAHSPLSRVLAGTDALRELDADAVVALGGGSAIVTARASTIVHAEGRDVHSLCTRHVEGGPPVSPRLERPKLPQFIVPATPTTACVKAGSAVLDPARGQRLALFDPKTRATAIFVHPEVALTAPPQLALGSALEAFASAVQGIESRRRDPLADALLLHALRLLARYLPDLTADPDNANTRVQLMLGAVLAGQGTDYAPSGLASAIAHCIGARLDRENGVTSGIVLPHAMRFNMETTQDRLPLVAETLGATDAATAVEALFARLGIPRRLRDIAVARDALPRIAEDVAGDWFLHQNPRRVEGAAEVLAVLQAAW